MPSCLSEGIDVTDLSACLPYHLLLSDVKNKDIFVLAVRWPVKRRSL